MRVLLPPQLANKSSSRELVELRLSRHLRENVTARERYRCLIRPLEHEHLVGLFGPQREIVQSAADSAGQKVLVRDATFFQTCLTDPDPCAASRELPKHFRAVVVNMRGSRSDERRVRERVKISW